MSTGRQALCDHENCQATRLRSAHECLAHVSPLRRAVLLKDWSVLQRLDATGVTFDAKLADELLNAVRTVAPADADGNPEPWCPRLRDTSFAPGASFNDIAFGAEVSFGGASFEDGVSFDNAAFGDRVSFGQARFGERVSFRGARFRDAVDFSGASFACEAQFDEVVFGDDVWFGDDVQFGDGASFHQAAFGHRAAFEGVSFQGRATFEEARFGDNASFVNAYFGDGSDFDRASFGDWARLGPLVVNGSLSLTQAVFQQTPTIQIASSRLTCRKTKFHASATFRLLWAEVILDEAEFERPSLVTAAAPFHDLADKERQLADRLSVDQQPESSNPEEAVRTERPRLLSLAGCDVSNLTCARLDLRACRFAGAYNIDQLRIDGPTLWPRTPGFQHGWAWPLLWRWTGRQTLAEEQWWRFTYERGLRRRGWYPVTRQWSSNDAGNPSESRQEQAAEIATIYRALRKGLEESKDEPGAADFYYGEMEMRRNAAPTRFERLLLRIYWLLSGYALRASRAVAALLVTVALFAGLFSAYGFTDAADPYQSSPQSATAPAKQPPRPWPRTVQAALQDLTAKATWTSWDAWTYSAGAATAIITDPEAQLTKAGRGFRVAIRILGLALFGLAVLSLRGRVKR